jgi:hypothetical protein
VIYNPGRSDIVRPQEPAFGAPGRQKVVSGMGRLLPAAIDEFDSVPERVVHV